MPSPYLLLSFAIPPGASIIKRAVTDALALHTSAWLVKHSAAVVKTPTLTEAQAVIDHMIAIEQVYGPDFACVAVLVPHQQAHWALDALDDPDGVKTITGRSPA